MIEIACIQCGKWVVVDATEEAIAAWHKSGRPIQDALPELSAAQREMLLSGLCAACWDELFAEADGE